MPRADKMIKTFPYLHFAIAAKTLYRSHLFIYFFIYFY